MGPFGSEVARSTAGVKGVRKFLDKIIKLSEKCPPVQPHPRSFPLQEKDDYKTSTNTQEGSLPQGGLGGQKKSLTLLHKTIKKVSEDIDNFSFNTTISALMIYVNYLEETY